MLDHYARLWPRIEELIDDRVRGDGPGLVLEGSALWPARVAGLTSPCTRAVWSTADGAVLRERMRSSADYTELADPQRYLADKFLARAERFQTLMAECADGHGLVRVDTGGRSVTGLADAVLTVVGRPVR